jgi:hypothetical protein
MPSIKETCSCGADFRVSEAELEELLKAVRAWRKAHKCVHSGLTEMGDINVSSSSTERADDFIIPELHIGFRPNEGDEDEE